ncbi:MAG TPA: MerR family transcriptional regulator [Chitinophagaceae bacterium]|nr:MerR family transcriptional regulator [Chitinophagaceae bacterium]
MTKHEQITFDFESEPHNLKKPDVITESFHAKHKAGKKMLQKRGRKSIKDMDKESELVEVPEDKDLYKKQYYSIGEVAKMFHANQSLIRFWETEFDILKPKKNKKGDRYFRPEDVKNLKLIHYLLRQKKYTVEGAKEYFKKNKNATEKLELIKNLEKIKSFLLELKTNL